jgi:hypothetical protein
MLWQWWDVMGSSSVGVVYILDIAMRIVEVMVLWGSEVGWRIVFMVPWWDKIWISEGNHTWMTLLTVEISLVRKQISSR